MREFTELEKALLEAHYCLTVLNNCSVLGTGDYSDRCEKYEQACLDAFTNPAYNEHTVDACMASFKANANTDNWCLLTGAMTVYQWAQKNMRNK